MLVLLFTIGTERFGLDASEIVEVAPYVEFLPTSQPHDFVSGEFSYRGTPTPVIDLGLLTGQSACPPLLSTRIILVRRASPKCPDRIIGLLAEKVTETVTLTPAQLNTTTDQELDEAAFKTPLNLDNYGTVQLLHLDRLLPAVVLDMVLG